MKKVVDPDVCMAFLSNGMPVITCRMPHIESFTCGIWTRVGSRYESAQLSGISHFLEHMVFKGTPRRTARRIALEVESVGAQINASTSRSLTHYYVCAPSRHLKKLCGVLFEMYSAPRLAERDIELERQVIMEEIAMCRDMPEECASEAADALLWPGHPLGRPITGTEESIAHIDRKNLAEYHRTHYHAGNAFIIAAGNLDHDAFLELAEVRIGALPTGKPSSFQPAVKLSGPPTFTATERSLQQMHLVFAWQIGGYQAKERMVRMILNNMLGGISISRLFYDLRERRGLCYDVSTDYSGYIDTGSFTVSVSLDRGNALLAARLIFANLQKLASQPPSIGELRRIRDSMIGAHILSLERSSNLEGQIGSAMLTSGRYVPREEWLEWIKTTTPEDITNAASESFQLGNFRLSVVGPRGCEKDAKEIIEEAGSFFPH
jgi:predicted Zn-dependent peptidase